MATWEDGPEYAPVQRPTDFADAPVAPLEAAPPVVDLAAGAPIEHPRFREPSQPVAPLETLIPPVTDERNPQLPFDVASATVTDASSAWSAAHYTSPSTAAIASQTPPFVPWEQPAATWPAPPPQLSGPAAGPPPGSASGPGPGQFAQPGTPGWFAPPPPGAVPVTAAPLTAGRLFNAASPGALICLLVGGLVFPLSPITLSVAAGLSTRATSAQRQLRIAYGIALGLLGLLGFLFLAGGSDFAEWWLEVSRAAQLISFGMIATTLILVGLGLRGRFPQQPRSGTWG